MLLDAFTPEILERADTAADEIRSYLADLAAQRRRHPREDLLSALVAAEGARDRLTEDELLTMGGLLFSAGFETTTHLLGNGLVALLEHEDQLDLLRKSPDLGPQAAEEVLRYDSSVQIGLRTALADTTVDGVPVPTGHRVVPYLGAANRDPARFHDPDRLDICRTDNGPLSFGGGIHYCLGAPLARLETSMALPAVVSRYTRIERSGTPERRNSLTLRGYLRLPVAFAR
jgi:cytochrome P450